MQYSPKHSGRWFVKCRKCRKPWSVDVLFDPARSFANPIEPETWRPCPHCGYDPTEGSPANGRGQRMWDYSTVPSRYHVVMGKVDTGRFLQPQYESPCDGRCTNARGPNCDCQCHGANHGSGRLVERWTPASEKAAV